MKNERGPLTDAALKLSERMMSASEELRKYMPIPFMAEKRKPPVSDTTEVAPWLKSS